MIVIEKLVKKYANKAILKDISLTINKGEIYGVVGTSGAGKSTLLRCLNGLEDYEGGSIKINNLEVKNLTEKEQQTFRKKIGMIFQDFTLLSRKSVFDNIALPMKCWGYSKKEIESKVTELLVLVGLEDKIHAMPDQLSGGQKQRVAIARALTLEPELLLCDEATSALDPKTTKEILELLSTINQALGITIIIVTHQISVIKQVCHKMALIEKGTVVEHGAVVKLFFEEGAALNSLLGKNNQHQVERTGTYIKILEAAPSCESLLYRLTQAVPFPYLLIRSEIESYRNQTYGLFLIKVEKHHLMLFENFFDQIKCVYQLIEEEEVK